MMEKVRNSLMTGLSRLKWIAGFLADRTKAETSAARLLFESRKFEGNLDDLYRDMGKKVVEAADKGATDMSQDPDFQRTLEEIRKLRETIADYKNRAKNVNKLPE